MVQVATSEPLSATLPQPLIVLAPSEKATVPARLEPLTVAVKVTLWPKVEGLPEVLTVVVVEPCAALTVWFTVPKLPLLLASLL